MKNILITLLAITFLTTACKKEDLQPQTNEYNIEVIHGTHFWVQTTDTSFMFATAFSNTVTVTGSDLTIKNMSKSNAELKVNNKDYIIFEGKRMKF